ncbi:MAG: hypothetical protein MSA15_19870 [Clostridium sp.]|nr:hypothetical protein [Clostridium sp.]
MKLDKRYIKFHEVGNNKYYLLPFSDELHIVTESILPIQKKFLFFKKKKDLVQGIKLLELTAPISMLFQEVISADVDTKDEEFPDMTTYKKVDNLKMRKTLEEYYMSALNERIEQMEADFDSWLEGIRETMNNLDESELNKIENANRKRLEQNIDAVKSHSPLNFMSFKWKSGENLVIKRMLDSNLEFLYSQKIGSNYKIYYLYEVDIFGVVTIYKIHCVKNIIKTMETFIYNREVIQEMMSCMINNNL